MESQPLLQKTSKLSFVENRGHDEVSENKHVKLEFFKLPRRKKYILVFCMAAEFYSGCSFSIMAPFYPKEAARKEMSASLIGFIFSIFELIIFISSPIIGANLTRIGSKFVFLSGIIIGGFCTILFGLLNRCPPGPPFIALSFVTRSIQGLGFSSFVTSSFAIVSSEFPAHVSTAFGMLQTCVGTGLMLGPVIGGALYQLGGFGLPFYVIGASVIINGLLVCSFLPDPDDAPKSKRQNSIFSLVRRPSVFIPMLSICTGALGITYMEPTLANHLEPFQLAPIIVGLFFVISPLMNSLSSPIWGHLTDTKNNIQGPILVSNHFIYGIAFLLIGPSPLLPFVPFQIWILIIGLALVGFTFASILINSMKCMVLGALGQGFEDNLDTYGIVAGLFNSMYTLGGFVGPMLGGILSEELGPSFGFTVVGLLAIVMSLIVFCFFVIRNHRRGHPCTQIGPPREKC